MATHNRAGEITYRQINENTFEFTIITYTYTKSPADRNSLTIEWGDNTNSNVPRIEKLYLTGTTYFRNTYVAKHTFPGPGIYEIKMEDPNRNLGVNNIPNSVNIPFSIKTTMLINPKLGYNNTPILLSPPIDKAARGHIFIHNPTAFDLEDDSISIEFTVCTGENGLPIETYTLPLASDSLYIDSETGNMIWDKPVDTGIFNIALGIDEWRNGIKIGRVVRDMQIEVYNTDNNPPVHGELYDYCVVANDSIEFTVTATDADFDKIIDSAYGGMFEFGPSKASFKTIDSLTSMGKTTSLFSWKTACEYIRVSPYNITFIATDEVLNDISLVDIDIAKIQVIGPPTEELELIPSSHSVVLSWKSHVCNNVSEYYIYRNNQPTDFVPDSCQTGLPGNLGFEFAGRVDGNENVFIDDDNGQGLVQGFKYCYRVIAVFENQARSIVSEEVCANLVPPLPYIVNVSVRKIDEKNGSVLVRWLKPDQLDTIPAFPPFGYRIYRSNELRPVSYELIQTYTSIDDTFFIDTLLNTYEFPYTYKVEFYYTDEDGNFTLAENPGIASSIFSEIKSSDNKLELNMKKNTPWVNYLYKIYRKSELENDFKYIGESSTNFFTDSNLVNGCEYCYRVESFGNIKINDTLIHTINLGHINCGIPIDTVPPAPPVLEVVSNCDSALNLLSWINQRCCEDIVRYIVYYSASNAGSMDSIAGISPYDIYSFKHSPEGSLSARYYVTAVDSFNNESKPSNLGIVTGCFNYKLPNVFTPNGDGKNEVMISYNPNNYIKRVDMKIFNRWGELVYETEDPGINWNGYHKQTKRLVTSGVYYYICDVYEPTLGGEVPRNLSGFVYVYTNKDAKVINE
ncbi:gliding motility-associated C-terminal domain-containing protein [Bacteroidota bacterium]